jgi:hypothetical protein
MRSQANTAKLLADNRRAGEPVKKQTRGLTVHRRANSRAVDLRDARLASMLSRVRR